jgi:hypothetical protein
VIRIGLNILIILLYFSVPGAVTGQIAHYSRWDEYSAFQEDYRMDTARSGQFYIKLRNANFFKNNEYASEFRAGSSLTGLFIRPSLDYYLGPRTMVRAGVHLLKYYGRDEIDRTSPVLTIHHILNDHVSMVFGTIYGTVNHGLKEPIFGFEKFLVDNYENGIQFLLDYSSFRGDIWLNWEQFIKEGDPFQEKFTLGVSTYFDLYQDGAIKLGIPFQGLIRHTGGQIDNTNLPAGTKSNWLQGLVMEIKGDGGFVNRLVLEQNWLQFVEINPGGNITVPYGFANYSIFKMETKLGDLSFGYWKASDFEAPHGEGLFLPHSDYLDNFYMADREVLSVKYQYYAPLNKFLDFILRFEPYYHFHSGRIDHSFSVFLVVDTDFFLAGSDRRKP